ncbi:MAG TPA: flagellar biosynthetic protein FliO [Glaciihabitans sp.]|nr:flagellar biosynthetic protein FliO [Glaciihabitans sp.]
MDTLFVALRVVVSLGAVLAVIWVAHRQITRRGSIGHADKPITIIGRQAVGQKASVVIIEVDGTRLLLGVTDHNISVLTETEKPAAPVARSFSRHLAIAEQAAAPVDTAASTTNGAELRRPRQRPPIARSGSSLSPASHGLLRGSILSAETWKLSWTALRQGYRT